MLEMNQILGVGVGHGLAIGRAHLLAARELDVPRYPIERKDVVHEIARLTKAFSAVRSELGDLRAHITPDSPQEVSAFLDLHRMILDDVLLSEAPRNLIRSRLINAEWALSIQLEEVCQQFDSIDDAYFRARSQDVRQVVDQVMQRMAGITSSETARNALAKKGNKPGPDEKAILIAHDVAPSDMLHLRGRADSELAGIVTVAGGATSHTAILARSLGLPALVGATNARDADAIHEGDLIVLDPENNRLIINPDDEALAGYRKRLRAQAETRAQLRKLKGVAARTRDGVTLEIMANIELPEDARAALNAGADGIGLFRSEFLFMNRNDLPSEDEQYEAYAKVARTMKGKPVVIRTLDIGADKVLNDGARESLGLAHGTPTAHSNPALGLRAIRYCLAYPELFLTQLRAILRASAHGTVRILVPMLAHVHEVNQTLAFVERACDQLKEKKQKFDAHAPVGGMIEVPAAALSVGVFARRLKFLSLGTNDLIQYTLAIDRTDSAVAHLYDHLHPAVLHLVSHAIKTAARARTPISVCGQMAGELELSELLLGMGLRSYSMHPDEIPSVKAKLMQTSTRTAAKLAAHILRQSDPLKIRHILENTAHTTART